MKEHKKTSSQMPYYCLLALIASLLCAAMLSGCNIYQREEVEIIRCPAIDADTIRVPGWDEATEIYP